MFDFRPDAHNSVLSDYAEQASFDGVASVWRGKVPGLARYCELVSSWGKKTDLVSAKNLDALLEVLFLDALALTNAARQHTGDAATGQWIDVGAGAGAPALPFCILNPDVHMTLLEPRRRRVMFMRMAIGQLGLSTRVVVEEGRLEPGQVRSFDHAVSRATFAPSEWLERGLDISNHVWVLLGDALPPKHECAQLALTTAYQTMNKTPRSVALFTRN